MAEKLRKITYVPVNLENIKSTPTRNQYFNSQDKEKGLRERIFKKSHTK